MGMIKEMNGFLIGVRNWRFLFFHFTSSNLTQVNSWCYL